MNYEIKELVRDYCGVIAIALVLLLVIAYLVYNVFFSGPDSFLGVKLGTPVSLGMINSQQTDLSKEQTDKADSIVGLERGEVCYNYYPKNPINGFDFYYVVVNENKEIIAIAAQSKWDPLSIGLNKSLKLLSDTFDSLGDDYKSGFDLKYLRDRNGEVVGYDLRRSNLLGRNRIRSITLRLGGGDFRHAFSSKLVLVVAK